MKKNAMYTIQKLAIDSDQNNLTIDFDLDSMLANNT